MTAHETPPRRVNTRRRTHALLAILVLAGLLIGVRLFELQVVRHERFAIRALDQARDSLVIPGPRGDITDRHGRVLAVSVPSNVLIVEPRHIERDVLAAIERAVRVHPGRLTSNPDDPWELATRDCDERCSAEINALVMRGAVTPQALNWRLGFKRRYPYRDRAAHVLGFVSPDGTVAEGIEKTYAHMLASTETRVLFVKDAQDSVIAQELAGPPPVEPPRVMLTIDLRIQAVLEDELAAAKRRHAAVRAHGVVLDPGSGEVLAMASVPAFDPNRYSKVDVRRHRNPVVEGAYEPGSVVKPLTAGVLLDAGAVNAGERVWCEEGRWQIGRRRVRDHHPHGRLSLPEIIEVSSNIGIAKLSRRISDDVFRDALVRFGFGRRTGIELGGESAGILLPVADWNGGDHETMAFGHAMSATPLQVAAAYAAVANGGTWVAPRVTRALGSPDGSWHRTPPGESHRAISEASATNLTTWLRRVVEGEKGTGRLAAIGSIPVSGKTGTAEKLVNGTYDTTKNVATFAGFAPSNDPRAVVVIVIDEPKRGGRTASTTAAPVFSRVMAETLRLMRVGGATVAAPPPRTEIVHAGPRTDRGTR